MASNNSSSNNGNGILTDEQREVLMIAAQNAEVLSSSPKSPTSLLPDHQIKVVAGGKASTGGFALRHVRRTHSGKLVRVKKDGAGGKGTWGKLLDTDSDSRLDRNDRNYDSGEPVRNKGKQGARGFTGDIRSLI